MSGVTSLCRLFCSIICLDPELDTPKQGYYCNSKSINQSFDLDVGFTVRKEK